MKYGYYFLIFSLGGIVSCDDGNSNSKPLMDTPLHSSLSHPLATSETILQPSVLSKTIRPIASGGEGIAPARQKDYQTITWQDLELPGQGVSDIVKQHPEYPAQTEHEPISESGHEGHDHEVEPDTFLDEMQKTLDKAPINPAMSGKKIKLPGFIVPVAIDEAKALVQDFLLVPYYGAGMHLPLPPRSQTILVKAQAGKGIGLERVTEPVWVYGTLSTEAIPTEQANAGYQINDAYVEIYQDRVDPSLSFSAIKQ